MSNEVPNLRGLSVTVMGLGSFGGGLGVVRYLLAQGARVTISDRRTADDLAASLRQLPQSDPLCVHLGEHREADFLQADLVVVNPAVRADHPLLTLAREQGVPLTSEIALFWQRCRGRIIGVTGTNGKSTTTRLLHHLLETGGQRTWLGGNIGGSLLADVDRIEPEDYVVLELSSFQLHSLNQLQVSPDLAVVTNFAPNHLDWHGTLDAYRDAKQTILRWQRPGDAAVLNAEGEVGRWTTAGRKLTFCRDDLTRRWPPHCLTALNAPHQQENAAAAVAAALLLGVTDQAVEKGLSNFVGLPHRLQPVGVLQGRTWIDDSSSTTPESTLAALRSFDAPIVLLVGGADKGVDLSALAEGIAAFARAAVLMGDVAGTLNGLITARLESWESETGQVVRLQRRTIATSPADAVAKAFALSDPGDVVLLSPGCASFGWFANYVDRGNVMAHLARNHAVGSPAQDC